MSRISAHENIDSLQIKLQNEKCDSIRLQLLNKIAWELRVSNPAKSIQLIDSIINLAKKLDQPIALAEAYNHLGIIYAKAGDYKRAVDWVLKGSNVSHQLADSVGIANALNNLGVIYWYRGFYDKSLEYMNLSLGIQERANKHESVAIIYNNIGDIYKEKGEIILSKKYLDKSIILLDSFENKAMMIKARLNLAEIYLQVHNYENVISLLAESEKLCEETGNLMDLCNLYFIRGKYYEQIKHQEKAEKSYIEAVDLAIKVKNPTIQKKALNQLSNYYLIKKNYKKAYLFKEQYHVLNDSLSLEKDFILLSKIEMQNELDKKLSKQNRINAYKDKQKENEINYQKKVRNFLTVGLFFLFVLGALSILIYRQKLKNAKILASQRQEIIMKNEILREQIEQDKMKTELLELMNEENEILSLVAKETDNTVFIINPDGKIEWINEAFQRLLGYSPEEFKRKRGINIFDASNSNTIRKNFEKCLDSRKPVTYVSKTETKSNQQVWIHTTLTPVLNEKNEVIRLIAIDADITKIKQAEELLALKNKEITWSLQYARKIQKALLPLPTYMTSIFPQHLIINLPQNIVSGDFYWVANKNNRRLAVVADSTGHGVPGAFMSLLGISSIQEIVANMEILEPTAILEQLREKIIYLLNYQGDDDAVDSLDIAICVIDDIDLVLHYAGSNNPAFVIRDDVLIEMKPDKYFIWDGRTNKKDFTLKTFQLVPDDRIYMFTDGYSDQFGGKQDKKFSRRRLKKMLLDIYSLPLETQKDLLKMELKNWQGNNEQIDDIMVVAFEV